MCGIIALLLASNDPATAAAPELCEGLGLLQHRGQDACGIVTCGPRGKFFQNKANGMVRDVLDGAALSSLIGNMGVGHVRYPTAGSSASAEAQPFYVNSPYGIVFAHNGNLVNTPHLSYYLDHYAHRHINTTSDSELLLNILADNLQKTGKFRIDEDDIFRAIGELMKQCHGSYACVAMLAGFGIIAFRDPNGIRPVGYGKRTNASGGVDYVMASESVVSDALGFSEWQDVAPGEAVIITKTSFTKRQVIPARTYSPDIFEYVYFARPDSVIDGISVYRARMAMGELLAGSVARALKESNAGFDIDVVIPVPDTSRVAALQLAQKMNIPYREGFVKNRYVGRTFIMPGQSMRRKNVRRKLNAMALEFSGKNVLLVDDSIVRGTTFREITQMARDAGAKKVIVASCAPPVRYVNVYGIDMPSRPELVAHNRTEEEIAHAIGADLCIFQKLPDLIQSCRQFNEKIESLECSVFTGEYVTGGINEEYLQHLQAKREDSAKSGVANGVMASSGAVNEQNGGKNGIRESHSADGRGCSGPLNGADALGLTNEDMYQSPPKDDGTMGLTNAQRS